MMRGMDAELSLDPERLTNELVLSLVLLQPDQLDRHVDTLVDEVMGARQYLEAKERELRLAQRVRNARARRRLMPAPDDRRVA